MKFVVTAGPTREHLDPVRFLSNPSTGKMGFAVARAAAKRGHEVALVAGPVSLKTPKGVRRIDVTSARDMLAAVERELSQQAPGTVFVSTAAVADWRPAKCAATLFMAILVMSAAVPWIGALMATRFWWSFVWFPVAISSIGRRRPKSVDV